MNIVAPHLSEPCISAGDIFLDDPPLVVAELPNPVQEVHCLGHVTFGSRPFCCRHFEAHRINVGQVFRKQGYGCGVSLLVSRAERAVAKPKLRYRPEYPRVASWPGRAP